MYLVFSVMHILDDCLFLAIVQQRLLFKIVFYMFIDKLLSPTGELSP